MADNNLRSPVATDGGNSGGNGGSGGDGSAQAMHRLRQVHVAHGGRIRTSWRAVLAATPLQRLGQATAGNWSNSSKSKVDGVRDGQRSLCGYSWALVRTRGVVGDEACDLACRIIEQGNVPDRSDDPRFTSDCEGVIGTEEEGGGNKAGADPSTEVVSSTASPWRWQCFDVDTTAWLPGDLLSLWIRLDEVRPFPPPSLAPGGDWVGGTPAADAAIRRGGTSRRHLPLCYHPLVRAFELRVVDDARAEEIARGCYALSRDRHQRPLASSSSTCLDGGSATAGTSAARFGDECLYSPACTVTASVPGASVAAVQLDFAAVCPMNMAAAGGSWA